MNQQQFGQMQADMAAMQAQMQQQQVALQQAQGQVVNAQAVAMLAQLDAQQAQAANAAQAVIVGQQQVDLAAAQALAAQAVADAATAQAAVNVAAAVIPGGGQAIVPAVNAPGQIVGLINLKSTNGLKIHKSASAPLRDLVDGQASKITTFINDVGTLNDVGTRARSFGWDALIFTINTAEHGNKNMLENYSSITMADITAIGHLFRNPSDCHAGVTSGNPVSLDVARVIVPVVEGSSYRTPGGVHFHSQQLDVRRWSGDAHSGVQSRVRRHQSNGIGH
jgi:hypothetical protein